MATKIKTKILSPVQRFWKVMEPFKDKVYRIYFYAVLSGFVTLSLPLGIQAIINFIQSGRITSSWVILVAFVLAGIAVNGILQVIQLRIVENIQQELFSRSSFEFSFRFPKIQLLELDTIHAPELVNRFFDTLTIQKGLPKLLIDYSLAAFQIVFGLILLSIYNANFLMLAIIFVVILWIIYKLTGAQGLQTSLTESKYKYAMAHWLEEVARVNKSFKAEGTSKFYTCKTDELAIGYTNARESHFQVLLRQFKFFIGFKVIVAASLLILGSLLVFNDQMNIGQFVAAEIIIILIINSVEKILQSIETIYDVLTALEKIGYVTDLQLDENGESYNPSIDEEIHLKVNDLEFTYPDSPDRIIHNLNFEVKPSEKVSLVGKSGSGKSTLLRLLAGFYFPDDGQIMFNNIRIRNIDTTKLYPNIGFCFPTNMLFDGTIKENITLGKEIQDQAIFDLIEVLNLKEFLAHQTKGIYSVIDSSGRRLPRAVIQKLLLARAIIHEPNLILLEDPLQFIPKQEKKRIIEYIMSPEKNWTVLVIGDDPLWKEKSTKTIEL